MLGSNCLLRRLWTRPNWHQLCCFTTTTYSSTSGDSVTISVTIQPTDNATYRSAIATASCETAGGDTDADADTDITTSDNYSSTTDRSTIATTNSEAASGDTDGNAATGG